MKKAILLCLLAAIVVVGAACDSGVNLGTQVEQTTIVEGMTVPEPDETVDASEPVDTLFEASIGPEAITTPDPVFSNDGRSITDFTEPSVATPVPVLMATPGPSQSFEYLGDTINVRYYDMQAQQPAETQYPVSDKTDVNEVVNAVTSALSDINGAQNIKLNGAKYSDGNLFVDFDKSVYDVANNSADEHEVLESIADTYLTNVDGIKAVYFTVDGQPYASEHTQLNENESYKVLVDQTQ